MFRQVSVFTQVRCYRRDKVRSLGNPLRAAAKGDPASSPGLVTAKLPPELIHVWWREQIDTPVTRAF
jgi:hypothetical protein